MRPARGRGGRWRSWRRPGSARRGGAAGGRGGRRGGGRPPSRRGGNGPASRRGGRGGASRARRGGRPRGRSRGGGPPAAAGRGGGRVASRRRRARAGSGRSRATGASGRARGRRRARPGPARARRGKRKTNARRNAGKEGPGGVLEERARPGRGCRNGGAGVTTRTTAAENAKPAKRNELAGSASRGARPQDDPGRPRGTRRRRGGGGGSAYPRATARSVLSASRGCPSRRTVSSRSPPSSARTGSASPRASRPVDEEEEIARAEAGGLGCPGGPDAETALLGSQEDARLPRRGELPRCGEADGNAGARGRPRAAPTAGPDRPAFAIPSSRTCRRQSGVPRIRFVGVPKVRSV